MHIEMDTKLDYSDVLLRPKRSTLESRRQVILKREFTFPHSNRKIHVVPIMAANMDGVGTMSMAKSLASQSMMTALNKSYTVEDLNIFYSNSKKSGKLNQLSETLTLTVGLQDDIQKVKDLKHKYPIICIDTPNGYMENFVRYVGQVRSVCGVNNIIIAGNVVTADQTQELILNGADIVKVGIGPGSVCTTRIVTGIGYPQLSAVLECADAAHGLNGHIVADGGCTCPGDIAKAFAAGADFVMLGGMLAGHKESELNVVNGELKFYGMSSREANEIHAGGLKDYRASEGRSVSVSYKGEVADTLQEIMGGLRSACTYVGARKLKDLPKCATFVRVNNQYNRTFVGG